MTPGGRQLRGEAGMTLVELMVGSLILVAGMLGVLGLVDTANGIAGENRARVAATNLGREVFEAARAVPYEELTPADIGPALKARPGLAGGTPGSSPGAASPTRSRPRSAPSTTPRTASPTAAPSARRTSPARPPPR